MFSKEFLKFSNRAKVIFINFNFDDFMDSSVSSEGADLFIFIISYWGIDNDVNLNVSLTA
jgi:hypothetical protein